MAHNERGAGRKPSPEGKKKDKTVAVYLTHTEFEQLKELTNSKNLSVSSYIRQCLGLS